MLSLQCLANLLKTGVEDLSDIFLLHVFTSISKGYNKYAVTLIHSIFFQEYPGERKDVLANTPK